MSVIIHYVISALSIRQSDQPTVGKSNIHHLPGHMVKREQHEQKEGKANIFVSPANPNLGILAGYPSLTVTAPTPMTQRPGSKAPTSPPAPCLW